jgi:hypothetical protein
MMQTVFGIIYGKEGSWGDERRERLTVGIEVISPPLQTLRLVYLDGQEYDQNCDGTPRIQRSTGNIIEPKIRCG